MLWLVRLLRARGACDILLHIRNCDTTPEVQVHDAALAEQARAIPILYTECWRTADPLLAWKGECLLEDVAAAAGTWETGSSAPWPGQVGKRVLVLGRAQRSRHPPQTPSSSCRPSMQASTCNWLVAAPCRGWWGRPRRRTNGRTSRGSATSDSPEAAPA